MYPEFSLDQICYTFSNGHLFPCKIISINTITSKAGTHHGYTVRLVNEEAEEWEENRAEWQVYFSAFRAANKIQHDAEKMAREMWPEAFPDEDPEPLVLAEDSLSMQESPAELPF
jgi:hypothetical protein